MEYSSVPVTTGTNTETPLWRDEKLKRYAEEFALVLIT